MTGDGGGLGRCPCSVGDRPCQYWLVSSRLIASLMRQRALVLFAIMIAGGFIALATVGNETTPSVGGTSSGPRSATRVIDGLDNVENSIFALGSVWAVTSNKPDEFSTGTVEADVVRIDPSTGHVEVVLTTTGIEPTFAQLSDRLWVKLVDRLVAFNSAGSEVDALPLPPGQSRDVLGAEQRLWVVETEHDRLSVIDPDDPDAREVIATGDYPVAPLDAFGSVWVPGLIDGTMTVIDVAGPGASTSSVSFVTHRPKNVMAVAGGRNGDEIWVSNADGELHAISAEPGTLGEVRQIEIDRPINRLAVYDDRAFLLPTWGRRVLVLDLHTEEVVAEIPIDSIPVRVLAAHDLIWVTGDGIDEVLVVIDPESLALTARFNAGSGASSTNGPQQPLVVDHEIWIPNRGDDAFFIVSLDDATADR